MNDFVAHILVVDDDEGIRSLIKQYLNENNFLVTTSNSAENAEEKISIIKFDLIVLDIMMTGKSGLDFIKQNKSKIDTPIILLTAKGEAENRVEGLEIGADDYLTKPFEDMELLNAIESRFKKIEAIKKGFSRNLEGISTFLDNARGTDELHSLSNDRPISHYKKKEVIYVYHFLL